jgi:uncharacterized DUF497 family protein
VRILWDPAKARANLAKHGVAFETAKSLLEGRADYLVIYDEDHSEDEDRFFAIGPTVDGLITVVNAEQIDDRIRIISARTATRRKQTLFRRHAQGHKR